MIFLRNDHSSLQPRSTQIYSSYVMLLNITAGCLNKNVRNSDIFWATHKIKGKHVPDMLTI